MSYYPYRNYLE